MPNFVTLNAFIKYAIKKKTVTNALYDYFNDIDYVQPNRIENNLFKPKWPQHVIATAKWFDNVDNT